MGRPDVESELNDLSNGGKTACDIKEENSERTELSSTGFVTWQQKQLLNRYFQTVWGQFAPYFINADDSLPLNLSDHKNLAQDNYTTYWYLETLLKAGLRSFPPPVQVKELHDKHCNLALLAEVAFAHSSNESQSSVSSGEEQVAINNRKDNSYNATDDSRCRRIRNNEACRKSRLRRKQLNAAAKEKLVTLSQNNDELKRKIVILEEEVKAAKNALIMKMEKTTRNSLGQGMVSSQWSCGGTTAGKGIEEKGMIEHVQ